MTILTFDIETWGVKPGYTLQPWRVKDKESGILMLAFDVPDISWEKVTPKTILCGWNLQFDVAFMLASGLEAKFRNVNFLDGRLLLKRLCPHLSSYSLKANLERLKDHLDCDYVSNYNQDIEFKVGTSEAYSDAEMAQMREYNERDAVYTASLIRYLLSKASLADIKQCIRESTVSYLFADAWQRGLLIDRAAVEQSEKDVSVKIENILAVLEKIGLTKKMLNSPKQLREYLVSKLEIELTARTDKGSLSVGALVLKNLYYKAEGVNKKILYAIMAYKKLVTEYNKFIVSAKKCLIESDYIHPEPFLQGTYTGRLTYSMYTSFKQIKHFKNGTTKKVTKKLHIGLPMHQIKRGKTRDMFIAPDGYQIAEFDFSGQEVRLMAAIANEQTMLSLFNEGKDLHAFTAASIAGMSYEEFQLLQKNNPDKYKTMRFVGKLTNLSLQYRLSAGSLYRQWHDKYGLTNKTLEDAEIARNTYLHIYSKVPIYWDESIELAQKTGYAQNLAGRKYALDRWDSENYYKSCQTAINFPIQSSGAEQKILALYILRPFLDKHKILFGWDLHDGMYFYMPNCMCITELVMEMKEILSNLPYEKAWGWTPPLEFPVDAKIGQRWGELKNV